MNSGPGASPAPAVGDEVGAHRYRGRRRVRRGRAARHVGSAAAPAAEPVAGVKPDDQRRPPRPAPPAQPPRRRQSTRSRDATPRPKKKVEAAAPPPEPAAPTAGELHIDSDVPGAMVFLDRKFVGNAPVTAKDVTPGTHRLNVTAEGYEGYSEPIEVAVGPADVMVKFKEIRLKEAVDVVHKHTWARAKDGSSPTRRACATTRRTRTTPSR